MKQIVQETTRRTVDTYTGEMIDETTSKTFSVKKEVEPFFLTYSRCMSILYNLTSLTAIKILWKFLERAEYNTGIVYITSQVKKDIIDDLNISTSIYNKAIAILKEAEIISGNKGQYIINPNIHWKGDYKTREKLIKSGCKLTITSDIPDEFAIKD